MHASKLLSLATCLSLTLTVSLLGCSDNSKDSGNPLLPNTTEQSGESALEKAARLACDKTVECSSDEEREQLGRDMLCVGVSVARGKAKLQGGACEQAIITQLQCFADLSCAALQDGSAPCADAQSSVNATCE